LFHNAIEYNTCIVLCDNAGDSMDKFFTDDTDKHNNKNNHSNYSDYSPYAHIYCSNLVDRYKNIGKRKLY
jgi:hypothetical protein